MGLHRVGSHAWITNAERGGVEMCTIPRGSCTTYPGEKTAWNNGGVRFFTELTALLLIRLDYYYKKNGKSHESEVEK